MRTPRLSPDTVQQLALKLDADTDVTAVAPMLVTANGNPAPQVGHLPPDGTWRPVFDSSQVGMPENPEPVPVDYARGAALMIRKFFLSAMREIDERYGQYGSDADLCFQIRRAGKKILILPNLRTVHHGGPDSALKRADMQLGISKWMGKYYGHRRRHESADSRHAGRARPLPFRCVPACPLGPKNRRYSIVNLSAITLMNLKIRRYLAIIGAIYGRLALDHVARLRGRRFRFARLVYHAVAEGSSDCA